MISTTIYLYRVYDISSGMRRFRSDCCDMRGMLGFLILFLLSKEPMHGQALADEIAKRKGEKPSPGTIYPALKNLREAGFIMEEENKDGKTIVYTEADRVCLPVPLYHCFGMVMGNLAATSHGACVVLPAPGFDPEATLRAVEDEKCTSLY